MIPPTLTPAVARALDSAQQLARRAGATDVQPLHLLHGLIMEEGRAATLLADAGLAPAAIQDRLAVPGPGPAGSSETPLPISPQVEEILQYAREVAAELSGDSTIASDHALLALLRRDESLRQELERLGLDLCRLESMGSSFQHPPLRLDDPLQLTEAGEQIDTARIVDASANRAREALRVIEDYCRFSLDDKFLSGQLKRLRHDLAQTLATLPASTLLEARDTLGDVGTQLSTPQEQERYSLLAVVQANCKRLQEALRSLEEYGKLHSPRLGQDLEKLRYRSYTLERPLILGSTARQRLAGARLYVIVTGSLCAASLDWTIQEAAAGGAQVIQLREKNLSDRELLERARKVRQWTKKAEVLFIVNDRPDIARLAGADGVHLGQDDVPIKDARRIVGPDTLIGVSTHNLDQVRQAVLDGASYIGVGPTFPSETKSFDEFPGVKLVQQVVLETSLPAFVLGGVNRDTIGAALAAGATRVAVSQAICQADDPRLVAAELRRQLETKTSQLP